MESSSSPRRRLVIAHFPRSVHDLETDSRAVSGTKDHEGTGFARSDNPKPTTPRDEARDALEGSKKRISSHFALPAPRARRDLVQARMCHSLELVLR